MTADPTVVAITSAIVTIIGTLTVQWAIARFAQHDRQASLQATNAESVKRIAKLEAENAELKAQVADFQTYIGHESIRDRYPFDETLGHRILDGKHFCHPCLLGTPPLVSQMTLTEGSYWCSKCSSPPRPTFKMPTK